MMRVSRNFVLVTLALLTALFLGAAYALWADVQRFPFVSASTPMTPEVQPGTGGSAERVQAVRLTVTETGIASISAGQLRAAELEFEDFSTSALSLTHNGTLIPFYVAEEDGEATLYFFAQAETSSLRAPNVYLLQEGSGTPMAERSAVPSGSGTAVAWYRHTWEDDSFFVNNAQGDDLWMGPKLLASEPFTYTFDDVVPNGDEAGLAVYLFSNANGEPDTEHAVDIELNGRSLGTYTWRGDQPETINIPLPAGLLLPDDSNTVSISVTEDAGTAGERIYIDAIELRYQSELALNGTQADFTTDAVNVRIDDANADTLIFDVTNRAAPVLLTNARYEDDAVAFAGAGGPREYVALAPDQSLRPTVRAMPVWEPSLYDTSRGADYIAIVADAPGFDSALEPLLQHRADQGYRVAAVPLEQIYDEFGYGHRSPDAIRSFLAYATQRWQPPAPRYVLLAGDATYDLSDRAPGKNQNLLPTPLVYTLSGFTASDIWYAQLRSSLLPSFAVGRFPAQNARQLRVMVDKTLAYEQNAAEGDAWLNRALFIADNEPDFEATSSRLANDARTRGYSVYELNMSYDQDIQHDIISAIKQGVGLVNYVGHGSEGTWGEEAVLRSSDATMLQNGTRLPILTTFTCRSGAFADPQLDALAESLLQTESGGVVAAVAPSGDGLTDLQLPTGIQFYDILLSDRVSTLGDALLELHMWNAQQQESSARDVLTTLNLLGDPALRVHKP